MRPLRLLSIAVVATAVVTLSACGTGPGPAAEADGTLPVENGVFPVTITHVYGETTISEAPERIAAVAWANHEVSLALGVVPVIQEKVTWGDDDDDGLLPWVEDKLEELGAEAPALYDPTDGIDFEAVNDAAPDVILASYSGLSREEYDTLSKIAPVVAYPEVAWGTSVEDMIRINSAAIGLAGDGIAFIDDLHAQIEEALAADSGLASAKVLFSYIDPSDLSQIGFYTTHDTRPSFLASIGLPVPSIVEEESAATDSFYTSVSSEEADRFADVDVFVTYGEDPEAFIAQLRADPLLSQIPAIAAGRVAILPTGPLAASANPSPLSIGWGIDEYFAVLAAAARVG